MQPSKPSVIMDNLSQHTSLAMALNANISIGSGSAFDPTTGIATSFTQDNGDGMMVRVGPGLPNVWGAANTATTIQHNLGRIPTGYYVTRKYQTCDVYDDGTNTGWTETEIVLKNTVANADTVVYIF